MNAQYSETRIANLLQYFHSQNFPEKPTVNSEASVEKIPQDILQLIWENASDGMRLTDSDGNIIAVNKAFCSLVHLREQELIGKPFTCFYAPDSINCEQTLSQYRNRLQTNTIRNKYEKEIRLTDNTIIEAEIVTSVVTDSAQEQYIITEFRDISERKRWERTLNESEYRFRSLFENSVLPLYQSTIDGKFVNANIALLNLLGCEDFLQLHNLNIAVDVYAHESDRKTVQEELQNGHIVQGREVELKRRDGSIITVLMHAHARRNEQNEIIGYEGALEDITQRKALERQISANIQRLETAQYELTKLNATKDKIIAIVSHDLRSPFSSILGFCDLLQSEFETLDNKEKLDYIGFIKDAAQHQLNLVNSLLDWSRLETGRINIRFQPIDIERIACDTINSLLGLAKKKMVSLQVSIPKGTTVRGDEQLLRQLLSNLVGNALKFTPVNGKISIHQISVDDSSLILGVTDTGIGIPENELKKLFKVEEKYSRTGLQGESGTGLGLPLCYEIMKKHSGDIQAESTEGKGTTFKLIFPKQIKSDCTKVLIVDDQKGNRLLLSKYIARVVEGAEILVAESGKEALESLLTNQPNLILTDYHMPVMDGIEFLKHIRLNEATKNIPVILISGDKIENHHHLDSATTVLRKPVAFQDLREILEKIRL